MKKAILKQLRQFAEELPILQTLEKVRTGNKYGIQLIEEGITKTENGDDIFPDKLYPVYNLVPKTIDHYENLKKIVRKEGPKGIKSYTESVVKVVKQVQAQWEMQRVLEETTTQGRENKVFTETANSETEDLADNSKTQEHEK